MGVLRRQFFFGPKEYSLHVVGLLLLQRSTNCTHSSCPPQWGPVSTVFWAGRPSGPAGWLAQLLLKAGEVETNPGPKHTRTQVWICDICHREITRKQTSLRCNHSEHWVHLRCAHIRVDQYTDTWICHLHRGSRLPHAGFLFWWSYESDRHTCHTWWSYESDRHTCHTKISMTQGLTAKFCVNLLSINITI